VAADAPPRGDRWVLLGRVTGAYGVTGWVKVFSYTDPRQAILDYDRWWLGDGRLEIKVLDGRRHGKTVVAALEGCTDRDAAAALLDTEIAVPRSAMPELEDGSFYFADLEGCAVEGRNGRQFGTVDYVLETGANDVLVVRGEAEILIPFVQGDTVVDVDTAAKRIVVDWPFD
jgi:16S rRNA processing protein RimM